MFGAVGKALGINGMGTSKQSSENNPWAPQGEHLINVFDGAQDLYNQGPADYYGGNTVAGINPMLQNTLTSMGGWGSGTGGDSFKSMNDMGQSFTGSGNTAANNLNNMLMHGTQPQVGIDMNQVNSFMDNDVLNGQIDAVTRDIGRNLHENTLTGIASNSVGTGNTGSSRRSVKEAIAERGAADRIADVSAGMRYNAYNDGMNKSLDISKSNVNNSNNLLNMGLSAGVNGANTMNMANGMQLNNMQAGFNAGNYMRGYDQQVIDADINKWNYNQNKNWDLLNKYYSMVGGNSWGGQSSGTATASPAQTIGGLMQSGGALMKGMGGGS